MRLWETFLDTISRAHLIRAGERVAVACSGGADSVALLLLLHELREELGIQLSVAHLNHQLRGAEADADEAFVGELAGRLGLECAVERANVAARARAAGLNLEEAAREARLAFFFRLCAERKADAVATAHTLDDQAETLLARLLRGTGLTGLAGIQPVLELPSAQPSSSQSGRAPLAGPPARLVRPLLGVRRTELRAYLQERKQEWREDLSNLDPARTRNRLRLEVLPQLERLNPAAAEHLAELAAQAAQEEAFWQVLIEERFRALAREQAGSWRIAARQLLEPFGDFYSGQSHLETAQRAVAQRLVRRLAAAARGSTRRLGHDHIEHVLQLAETGQSGQQIALPGLRVERVFDELVFHAPGRPLPSQTYRLEVSVPGSVALPGSGRRLDFKLVAASELAQGYNGGNSAALDAEAIGGLEGQKGRSHRLTVRNWRPGDTYQPLGSARPKKLKTLFQRARVPAAERARWPVVVNGDRILWTPRFGVASDCAVGERTRTALVIIEQPLPETGAWN